MQWFKKFLILLALSASLLPAKELKEINFGVIPVAGTSSLEEYWNPVVEHLQTALNLKVNLKFVGDYAALITSMQHKHVDIAYFGPESYVQAAKRANAVALVKQTNQSGVAGYRGIIITKKGSNLNAIKDLKGKTWAFTDPNSTSGTLVPSIYLKEQGIEPKKYFSKVVYSGSHEASILSVKSGRIDAAATNDLDFNVGLGKGWDREDFNIIWTSDIIVGAPVAARKDLPQSLQNSIQKALVDFKDSKVLERMKSQGFIQATDRDYDPVREIVKMKETL